MKTNILVSNHFEFIKSITLIKIDEILVFMQHYTWRDTNSIFEGRLVKTVKVMRVLFIIFHTNFLNTSQHAWHNIPWYDKHKRSRDIFWCFLIITCHVTASKFHTGGIDQSPPSTHSYPQPDPTGYPLTSQRASQPMSYHLFWNRSCTFWIHNIQI